MSPLIPKPRKPWQDDPGHIHDSPGPPPTEGERPVEQDDLGPGGVSAPGEGASESPGGVSAALAPASQPHTPAGEAEEVGSDGEAVNRDPAAVPDINQVDVPAELEETIRKAMARYPEKRSASIPALWAVQHTYGWCSPEGVVQAAAVMGVTPGYLQSVATFYDLFHTEPTGSHEVLVCTNISCWLRGADDILKEFIDAADSIRSTRTEGTPGGSAGEAEQPPDLISVRGFECLGACDIAPMASIDERYFGPLEAGDGAEVMRQLSGDGDVLPAKRLQDRKAAGEAGR